MLACMRDDAGVTFSAGVTAFPDIPDGPATMMKDAHSALYAAKRAGKGRVVLAWETAASPSGHPAV